MHISVLIPLLNEEESLPELHSWIQRVMLENNFSYEIVFIDDGSTDDSWNVIQNIQQNNACVKEFVFRKISGNRRHCTQVLPLQMVMLLLLWMPIYKTVRMKSPNSTG